MGVSGCAGSSGQPATVIAQPDIAAAYLPLHARVHLGIDSADGAAVVVGAGVVFRTLLTMINGAVRLLGLPTGDLVFAKSESDAWETVAERRTRWRERTLAKRAAAKPL